MKVSIVIPVYNVASYVEDCLRSVMRQTYSGSMECLIVDDCGTDDSMAIVERTLADYDGPIQFKVIHHEHNRGLSMARNTGTEAAAGDYIYFLDSDDEITDDCVELLMRKADEYPDAEFVQGNTETISAGGYDLNYKNMAVMRAASKDEVRKCFFQFNGQLPASAWNKLIRRPFLLENNLLFKEGVYYEDRLWMFYLLKHITCACFLPEVTYRYRIRPNSIMTASENVSIGKSYIIIYDEIIRNLTSGYEQEELNYYAERFAYYYTRYVKDIPAFKDDYYLYKEKARAFDCTRVLFMLLIWRLLGKINGSWKLVALMKRVLHPSVIPDDIRRMKTYTI